MITFLIVSFLVCLAVFLVGVIRAPLGWEDEEGFHYTVPTPRRAPVASRRTDVDRRRVVEREWHAA